MCEEYSTETRCENENSCKLMKLLRENQDLKQTVKKLRAELADARLNMSYMANPNAIDDRNDMGW